MATIWRGKSRGENVILVPINGYFVNPEAVSAVYEDFCSKDDTVIIELVSGTKIFTCGDKSAIAAAIVNGEGYDKHYDGVSSAE